MKLALVALVLVLSGSLLAQQGSATDVAALRKEHLEAIEGIERELISMSLGDLQNREFPHVRLQNARLGKVFEAAVAGTNVSIQIGQRIRDRRVNLDLPATQLKPMLDQVADAANADWIRSGDAIVVFLDGKPPNDTVATRVSVRKRIRERLEEARTDYTRFRAENIRLGEVDFSQVPLREALDRLASVGAENAAATGFERGVDIVAAGSVDRLQPVDVLIQNPSLWQTLEIIANEIGAKVTPLGEVIRIE